MPRLEISLLGPFQVTLDSVPVTRFGADTARALLAYLAMQAATPHRRESLAGLLWPDQPEREARHNLSQALLRLRAAIGDRDAAPPFLLATRETIQFNPESDCWLDVSAFEEALAFTRHHRHRRVQDCAACAQRLRDAAALHGGAFLDGFSLDSALYEEWVVVERERLHRFALEALGQLAVYHEGQGAYEEAVGYARRALALEPWWEAGHRQVMRGLALGGDRSGALAQYEVCRATLLEELGVEPEEETRELYEQIRDGELAARSPEAEARLRHNLPTFPAPLIGRGTELAEIYQLLSDPACRLLTLVGPGGIGKTRLAVEAARRQLERYADGVFLVPLAAVPSPEGIVPAVAQAIGFSFYERGEPKQQLLDCLRRRRMLLVLDNYEHLLEGADLATEILRAAPGIQIVTTTRARLNVRGEQLLPIGGMRYPETLPGTVSEVDRYSAVQLFITAAREVRVDFQPGMEDLGHVAQICRLVDGMPLAILLAAAWMRMLTPDEIAAEIAQAIDFLAADWRDAPERQRSMRAVFDHSWRLLSEREQGVLEGLSVFRGGFTRRAAEQVTGASLRELMVLVDRSLLHRALTGRYEMHELLRQYAAEKLDRSPAAEGVRNEHCAHYVSVLEQFERDVKGPRQDAALAEMDPEIENARAAWAWAAAQGHVERLDRAMEGLGLFYDRRYRYPQGETAMGEAVQSLSETEEGLPGNRIRVLAKALAWQGLFARQLQRWEHSIQPLKQGHALLERPSLAGQDTRAERAFVLFGVGWSVYMQDHEEATRCFDQSLALYQVLGNRWWAARALRGLSTSVQEGGDLHKSRQCAKASMAIYRSLGDRWETARSGSFLSYACALQGRAEEAERVARESFAIEQRVGGQVHAGERLSYLGLILAWIGKYVEAQSILEESVSSFANAVSNRFLLAEASAYLGLAKMHLGEYEEARAQGETALTLTQGIDSRWSTPYARLVLGRLSLVRGAYAEARELIQDSVVTPPEVGRRHEVREALASLGLAARGLGDHDQARRCLYECLQLDTRKGSVLPVLYALPAAALLLTDREEVERAVELYALASRYPVVANSRWFEDVAGRQIAAVAAETLVPEVIAAAQERGRERHLWATVEELLEKLEE